MPNATVVYIEYDNGTAEIARGDHAAQVMDYLNAAQVMAHVHGAEYKGKPMEKTEPLVIIGTLPPKTSLKAPTVELSYDKDAECYVSRIPSLNVISAGNTEGEARAAAYSAAALHFLFLRDQEEKKNQAKTVDTTTWTSDYTGLSDTDHS